MSDREPPNQPRKPNLPPKRPIGVIPMVLFLAASGYMAKTLYDVYVESNKRIEALKAGLDKQLKDSALDVSLLDAFLKYAKDGTIKPPQCDIADVILQTSAHESKLLGTNREVLVKLSYLSAAENDNYIQREKALYGTITMKANQLKGECNRIFNAIPAPQAQPQPQAADEPPLEWWQKPEIIPDYNKRELVPDYLK